MVPTSCGPVDVASYRAGGSLEDDLARRDFTIHAIAYEPAADTGSRLVDPFGGVRHLQRKELHAVGCARSCLEEDPLRALRAARLVAELALLTSAELEEAMGRTRSGLRSLAVGRIRQELTRLLIAPRPGAALELLRRTGIEAVVAPGVAAGAPCLVDRLPRDLALRLAGWMRGTHPAGVLGRLRFSAPLVRDVEALLALHPLDEHLGDARDSQLRRLVRRTGEHNLARLFLLREAELGAGRLGPVAIQEIRVRLAELRERLDRLRCTDEETLRRTRLAIGGREVMEVLDVGPGPVVGRALGYLDQRVQLDPDCNNEERLRELLRAWSDAGC
jgi:tRNA nucleotidyltransferase (CCA-adding enzyme)